MTDTSEIRGAARMGFHERLRTILNQTERDEIVFFWRVIHATHARMSLNSGGGCFEFERLLFDYSVLPLPLIASRQAEQF